jgi:outer membrane protein TolC
VYQREAALRNPGLEAAWHRWKAALEKVPQARSLPDPRFTYSYYIQHVETRVGPQRHALAVAQMFPWFGKLMLRGGVAWEGAEAERRRFEAAQLKLDHTVAEAYYERYYLGKAIQIVEENLELVKYLEGVARARYRAAAARHPDVIRAQVELGKLEDRLRTLKELDGPLSARLNAALGQPVLTPLPFPKTAPVAAVDVGDERLLDWLEASSPELSALDHETKRAEKAVSLARQEYVPDVTLGLTWIETGRALNPATPDSGKDPVIAMLSVNVPIWLQRIGAGVREAKRRLRSAQQMRWDRGNTLGAQVKMACFRFRDAERKMALYGDTLVPKARESLAATDKAYQAGDATFLDLVDAERVLLEFMLMRERSVADYNQRLAELEMLVGRPLPRRNGPARETRAGPDVETGGPAETEGERPGPAEPAGTEARAGESPEAAAPRPETPETEKAATREMAWWTCPMHPEVYQPGPGKCPKCGMDMIRQSARGPAGKNAEEGSRTAAPDERTHQQ